MEDKPPKKGSQDCRCLTGVVGLVLVAPGSHTICVGSLMFWVCAVVACSLLCAGLNTRCLSVFVLGMDQLFSRAFFRHPCDIWDDDVPSVLFFTVDS